MTLHERRGERATLVHKTDHLAKLAPGLHPALIDMGRPAINVSGSMTAGTVTSHWLGQTDMAVFAADEAISPTAAEDHATAPTGHPALPAA